MYLLWCGLCIVSTILIYFFIPETSGLPIEEIGGLFGDEVVIHLTADGTGIVEEDPDFKNTLNHELENVEDVVNNKEKN
jgi:hypothetical protein